MSVLRTATARVLTVLLVVAGTGAVTAAGAMSVRQTKTPLARSADGATLFEVRGDGPEGGGSLSYRVQGRSRRDAVDFLVSSDFSPGDGSTPQAISVETCRGRIAALGAEITKRKIPGVTLHPERCNTDRRAGLVVAN
jgi:hypothetical protein